MVDQATANMVMRDVLGYDLPGEQKNAQEPSIPGQTVEMTNERLIQLIEGKPQAGASSSCVLAYLNQRDGVATPVKESKSKPASNELQLIADMLGSF